MAKKNVIQEFKKFAFKGNVLDMAVGVMIGGAFSSIVNSLVNDVFMPVLGLIVNTKNLDQIFLVLKSPEGVDVTGMALDEAKAAGATVLSYGNFIAAVINFLLIAIIIFAIVSLIRRAGELGKKKEDINPAKPVRLCPYCRQEIADDATRCPHCTSEVPLEEKN